MKRIAILLLTCLIGTVALGQPPAPPPDIPDPQDMRRGRIHDRIEAMRIWKLTEALALDADRATVFFPRYRIHLAAIDSLEAQRMQAFEAIQAGVDVDSTMDYQARIKQIQKVSREILDQQERFLKANNDLLNDQEQAAFMMFEHRFHQRLRDIVRDLRMDHAPPMMHHTPDRPKSSRRER